MATLYSSITIANQKYLQDCISENRVGDWIQKDHENPSITRMKKRIQMGKTRASTPYPLDNHVFTFEYDQVSKCTVEIIKKLYSPENFQQVTFKQSDSEWNELFKYIKVTGKGLVVVTSCGVYNYEGLSYSDDVWSWIKEMKGEIHYTLCKTKKGQKNSLLVSDFLVLVHSGEIWQEVTTQGDTIKSNVKIIVSSEESRAIGREISSSVSFVNKNIEKNTKMSKIIENSKDNVKISDVIEQYKDDNKFKSTVSKDKTTDSKDKTTDSKDKTTDSKDKTTDSKDKTPKSTVSKDKTPKTPKTSKTSRKQKVHPTPEKPKRKYTKKAKNCEKKDTPIYLDQSYKNYFMSQSLAHSMQFIPTQGPQDYTMHQLKTGVTDYPFFKHNVIPYIPMTYGDNTTTTNFNINYNSNNINNKPLKRLISKDGDEYSKDADEYSKDRVENSNDKKKEPINFNVDFGEDFQDDMKFFIENKVQNDYDPFECYEWGKDLLDFRNCDLGLGLDQLFTNN